jgi:hypothetical protein
MELHRDCIAALVCLCGSEERRVHERSSHHELREPTTATEILILEEIDNPTEN